MVFRWFWLLLLLLLLLWAASLQQQKSSVPGSPPRPKIAQEKHAPNVTLSVFSATVCQKCYKKQYDLIHFENDDFKEKSTRAKRYPCCVFSDGTPQEEHKEQSKMSKTSRRHHKRQKRNTWKSCKNHWENVQKCAWGEIWQHDRITDFQKLFMFLLSSRKSAQNKGFSKISENAVIPQNGIVKKPLLFVALWTTSKAAVTEMILIIAPVQRPKSSHFRKN